MANHRPLTLLTEAVVLGGTYLFGRGTTLGGHPMLYISIPGRRGGLVVLRDNLDRFRDALDEAIRKFDVQPPPKRAFKHPCPGADDDAFVAERGIEGEVIVPHECEPSKKKGLKVCLVCGYAV